MHGCSRRQLLGCLAWWPLSGSWVAAADSGRFTGQPLIRYRPARRGAPTSRVASGSRTFNVQVHLSVLAPDQVGLSAQAQPHLYWYMDRPLGMFLDTALHEAAPQAINSLFQRELPTPTTGGIHSLALSTYGVRLLPGVEYDWLLAVVLNPQQRSYDIVASGAIRYEPPPAMLASALVQASAVEQAQLYAESGYWYDALHTLAEQIAQHPNDPAPYRLRAELLQQVGLNDAAAYARTQAG